MRLVTRTRRDESGVTIILFALTVVVLLIMASFAVDLGQTYNERNQDQASADSGVLGGALKLFTTPANPLDAAVAEARDFVDRDLGRSVPAAAWTNCTDSGHLYWTSNDPALGLANASQCISFDRGFAKMRVVVPTQRVPTAFASVMGIDSLSTTALAEAGAAGAGAAGTLPFSVFSGASAGNEACLKGGTNANSSSDCGGSTNGQFGAFNPDFYSAANANLPASCVTARAQATSFSPASASVYKATMKQCLVDWAAPNTSYDQLFVEDLARSPRFASVPKFAEAQNAAGTFFHVVGFVP